MNFPESIPWGAILTAIVLVWSVGLLALVERLRRTFSTPKELEGVKDELCRLIERLEDKIGAHDDKIDKWENETGRRFATREELNGWGARVGNLEEMYRGTATLAQQAYEASRDAQREIKHLTSEVTKSLSKIDESVRSTSSLSLHFAEMRAEMRMILGLQRREGEP